MIAVLHWWLSALPVDMRCSIDRLSARVLDANVTGLTPHTAYLFCNRSGTRLKVLVWDGLGFWIHYRRLEKAGFVWPALNERGVIELTHAQFAVLTQGLDWRRVRAPEKIAVSIA